MEASLVVAIISAATAITVAALSYSFARRREREADWRRLKLDHYKEYVSALSGIVGTRESPTSQARYADARNALRLVAPPEVLRALKAFQDEIAHSNVDYTLDGQQARLNVLIREIRRDVQPTPPDDGDAKFELGIPPPRTGRR
jgi:hypothetical protein